jgi:hypothetical protein
MYLMKPSTHAARGPDAEVHLLISAHGAVLPGSFTIPAGLDLHFYGKHSAAIRDPGAYDIMKGNYQVLETQRGGDTCSNYLLSKYQEEGGDETYESLQANLDMNAGAISRLANRTAVITDRNFAFEFDVLTIRNRWHHKLGVSFSTVLDTLVRGGHR